jgi:hypothetical protein
MELQRLIHQKVQGSIAYLIPLARPLDNLSTLRHIKISQTEFQSQPHLLAQPKLQTSVRESPVALSQLLQAPHLLVLVTKLRCSPR